MNESSEGLAAVSFSYLFLKPQQMLFYVGGGGPNLVYGQFKKIVYVQCRLDVPLGCLQFYFILFTEIELTNM